MTSSSKSGGEPRLITFLIPLPVPLPLPHRSTYTFELEEELEWLKPPDDVLPPDSIPMPLVRRQGNYEAIAWVDPRGRNHVFLQVWRPREELSFSTEPFHMAAVVLRDVTGIPVPGWDGPPEPPAALGAESYCTVIRAETALLGDPARGWESAATVAFGQCLASIEALRRAYSLATRDHLARPVTRQTLYPFIPFTTKNPFAPEWSEPRIFALNDGLGTATPREGMSDEDLRAFAIYLERAAKGDPLTLSLDWSRLAYQALEIDGDYRSAVTALHTSGEVMFDALLLMMAWEEGLDPKVAAHWFEARLAKRLRTHYATRIGGDWQSQREDSVIGRWLRRVSYLRNRVAHAGYVPTEAETREAMRSHSEVQDFIKEKLSGKLGTYPRTALFILGTPGLERRGLYSDELRLLVERAHATEGEWLSSFRRWADEVTQIRRASGG